MFVLFDGLAPIRNRSSFDETFDGVASDVVADGGIVQRSELEADVVGCESFSVADSVDLTFDASAKNRESKLLRDVSVNVGVVSARVQRDDYSFSSSRVNEVTSDLTNGAVLSFKREGYHMSGVIVEFTCQKNLLLKSEVNTFRGEIGIVVRDSFEGEHVFFNSEHGGRKILWPV